MRRSPEVPRSSANESLKTYHISHDTSVFEIGVTPEIVGVNADYDKDVGVTAATLDQPA